MLGVCELYFFLVLFKICFILFNQVTLIIFRLMGEVFSILKRNEFNILIYHAKQLLKKLKIESLSDPDGNISTTLLWCFIEEVIFFFWKVLRFYSSRQKR